MPVSLPSSSLAHQLLTSLSQNPQLRQAVTQAAHAGVQSGLEALSESPEGLAAAKILGNQHVQNIAKQAASDPRLRQAMLEAVHRAASRTTKQTTRAFYQ